MSEPGSAHLCYEGYKVSKFLVVLARLQIEDIQARFVVTPLQSKVVCVAFVVSLDAALCQAKAVSRTLLSFRSSLRTVESLTCRARRLVPLFTIPLCTPFGNASLNTGEPPARVGLWATAPPTLRQSSRRVQSDLICIKSHVSLLVLCGRSPAFPEAIKSRRKRVSEHRFQSQNSSSVEASH